MANVSNLLRFCLRVASRRTTFHMHRGTALKTRICGTNMIRMFSTPISHEDVRQLTNAEWQQRLTAEQFSTCREQCTEPPYSGRFVNHFEKGKYSCVCCDTILFSSDKKYDSESGWPSFNSAYQPGPDDLPNVIERRDNSLGMVRTEVICRKCDSHLGHVFEDGPAPTGLRYCMNSVSLKFEPE